MSPTVCVFPYSNDPDSSTKTANAQDYFPSPELYKVQAMTVGVSTKIPGNPPEYSLLLAKDDRAWVVSSICEADPFPSIPSGARCFYIRNYSENQGVLEGLEALKIVKQTGKNMKQGFVTLPLVELLLLEEEVRKNCNGCGGWESAAEGAKRFLRCSGCRKVFYCDEKCQLADWKGDEEMSHKRVCKLEIEKAGGLRQAEQHKTMTDMGFRTNDFYC